MVAGRIKKAGPRRAPVSAATLQPVRRMAGERVPPVALATGSVAGAAHLGRREMGSEEVSASNVREAASISLLRVKARTVSAHRRRVWRCLEGAAPTPFSFVASEVEGVGALHQREKRLADFIETNEKSAESILQRIRVDAKAQARLKKANKGGGKLKKDMQKRDAAIDEELNRRLGDGSLYSAVDAEVVANADQSAQPVPTQDVMPASYADDIRRMHHKLDAEEAGIRKPTQNERVAAARAVEFDRGDFKMVEAYDNMIARRQATRRRARQRKKVRKAETRAYSADLFNRDPSSDVEK